MLKFNKDHLVAEYQNQKAEEGKEVSNKQAKDDVDTLLASIIAVVEKAKNEVPNKKGVRAKLQLTNFGVFELKAVPDRYYGNPMDREAEKKLTPAHNKVTFSDGKYFTEAVN